MSIDYRLDLAARVLSESEAGLRALAAIKEFVASCAALDEIERASVQTVLNARLADFATAEEVEG